jgi:hypothetical protein
MTPLAAITEHHQLCDELHQLAMEENRFLRQHQRAPEAALLDRKRALLARLDETLGSLRSIPAASARDSAMRQQLENTRARILQILQLDKENEQLLLRYSLVRGRPDAKPAPSPSVSMLQRIYARSA